MSSYWSEVVENIPENFDDCCFHPSCAQGPFTGTHWNIYLYPDLCMVSGPYAEGVRGMRSYPPFGAHYFKTMQFLVYTPISDPKMVIFLKIRTPFSKDCVWAWVLWLNICFSRTKGKGGLLWLSDLCLLHGLGPSTDCTPKKIPKEFGIPQKYPFTSSYPKVSGL